MATLKGHERSLSSSSFIASSSQLNTPHSFFLWSLVCKVGTLAGQERQSCSHFRSAFPWRASPARLQSFCPETLATRSSCSRSPSLLGFLDPQPHEEQGIQSLGDLLSAFTFHLLPFAITCLCPTCTCCHHLPVPPGHLSPPLSFRVLFPQCLLSAT